MNDHDGVSNFNRAERIGVDAAVFSEGKTADQITTMLDDARFRGVGLLLNRLADAELTPLPTAHQDAIDYCHSSRAADRVDRHGDDRDRRHLGYACRIGSGTNPAPSGGECDLSHRCRHCRTLVTDGSNQRNPPLSDRDRGSWYGCGACQRSGDQVPGAMICVSISMGYDAPENGGTVLNSMLASCAPGITVCNIDNGYGTAVALCAS